MKKQTFIISFIFAFSIAAFAQPPQAFKYQAVVRDSSGNIITSQLVSIRCGILQDSINSAPIYSETHTSSTNQFGLISVEIGKGTIETGIFGGINWGSTSHFLKIELDEAGGTNFHIMGISQLLSVPYALQANIVTNDKDEQTFSVSGDTLFISNGNYVVLPGIAPYISWNCGDIVTDFDGNTYNTALIGYQCWMKENLKVTTYKNGTPIPNVTDNSSWAGLTTGAYVWYNNDISWKDKYGAIYNWYTVVNANGLCPTSWHVPTNGDWTELTDFIGGLSSPHGNELKSCRQINSPLGGNCNTSVHPRWNEHGTQYGTDNYGFSGLPGGNRNSGGGGYFGDIGSYGGWWSSTEFSSMNAWGRLLGYGNGHVTAGNYYNKKDGFSVRCLRD